MQTQEQKIKADLNRTRYSQRADVVERLDRTAGLTSRVDFAQMAGLTAYQMMLVFRLKPVGFPKEIKVGVKCKSSYFQLNDCLNFINSNKEWLKKRAAMPSTFIKKSHIIKPSDISFKDIFAGKYSPANPRPMRVLSDKYKSTPETTRISYKGVY
jgi:hypothetical protein